MSFLKGYLGARQLAMAEQEAARQKAQQKEIHLSNVVKLWTMQNRKLSKF